jgi:hypothetical protein
VSNAPCEGWSRPALGRHADIATARGLGRRTQERALRAVVSMRALLEG